MDRPITIGHPHIAGPKWYADGVNTLYYSNITTYRGCCSNILFESFDDLIMEGDWIQCPAFVSSGNLLSHGSQKSYKYVFRFKK